jgi:hypothetical protein
MPGGPRKIRDAERGGLYLSRNSGIFILAIVFTGLAAVPVVSAQSRRVPGKCELYGRIQIVEAFPDARVQVVEAFPDIRVQKVPAFADSPGKWQIVESSPDWKVQIVDAFPDYKIQWVDAFPGCK